MGFLMPDPPAPPKPPPPVPQIDEGVKMRNEQDRLALRRGRGTTVLTSDQGLPNLGATSTPTAGGM
jgi:hypothetical protein